MKGKYFFQNFIRNEVKDLETNYFRDFIRDPVFGHVLSKPKNCLRLLRAMYPKLGVEAVTVTPQKVVKGKINDKGSRFDVWAVDQKGRGFDIEMQKNHEYNIGQRFRYYEKQVNRAILKPGQRFDQIKEIRIAFISPFDPFDSNKCEYRIYNIYDPQKPYNEVRTGMHWYYFNAAGEHGRKKLNEDLIAFLNYIHGKIDLNNQFIRDINNDVKEFIAKEEWGGSNMTIETLKEDATLDAEVASMKKTVKFARNLGASDKQIIDRLVQDYGNHFTRKRIERLVQTGK